VPSAEERGLDGHWIRILCVCGWEKVGTKDEVIPAAQEHGRRVHNMDSTEEEILARAEVLEDEALTIADNADERQYEARIGDRIVGFSQYGRVADRIVFLHTEVDESMEGRGVGSRLAAGAIADVRAKGLRITARCPFIAAWLERHPEHADLIAR
jgi:predicted GNAT family acetyltransferase